MAETSSTAGSVTAAMPSPRGWLRASRWSPLHAPATQGGSRPQLDPGSGEVIGHVAEMTAAEVGRHLSAVRQAYDAGGTPSPAQRASYLSVLADRVDAAAQELGTLDSLCTGKIRSEGIRTVRGGAALLRYYAGLAADWSFRQYAEPVADNVEQLVDRIPVGLVACILPWNFPVSQACARLGMLLASGNATVLKGSELASPPLLALEQLAADAGIPPSLFSVITGAADAGRELTQSPLVDGVCFTGGIPTGIAVATAAMATLKRVVLELGGKSPNIVFADAPAQAALTAAVAAAFRNQGEVCSAGSLLLVERSIHDDFVAALATRAAALRIGHQLDESTELGPLVSRDQLQRVERLVDDGRAAGAVVKAGGRRPEPRTGGYFYQPTVLTDVPDSTAAGTEEIFGPVVVTAPFSSEDEVIARANSSKYGLAAAIWTADAERAARLRDAIRAGIVWTNVHGPIPRNCPWGGFRYSGLGRLYGSDGLLAFTEARTSYRNLDV